MSSRLWAIVGGILLVLPELEAALRVLQPRNVRRKPFQLALGEDFVDLAGRGLLDLLQGREDPIPPIGPLIDPNKTRGLIWGLIHPRQTRMHVRS